MAGTTPTKRTPRRSYASPQVVRLIDRIKLLVAEQRELERRGNQDRLDAIRYEIGCLRDRLAEIVRRELNTASLAPSV